MDYTYALAALLVKSHWMEQETKCIDNVIIRLGPTPDLSGGTCCSELTVWVDEAEVEDFHFFSFSLFFP